MTVLKIGPDNLASARFALSPMVDTVAALLLLSDAVQRWPYWRGWANRRREEFDALTAEPVRAAIVQYMRDTSWVPDFMTPPPQGTNVAFAHELAVVSATPAERAHASFAADRPLPHALDQPDLAPRTAGLLSDVWTRFLAPEWPRRRAMLERDVIKRAGRLAVHGWASALDGLTETVRWLGSGRIEVNDLPYPAQDIRGAELLLVPCSFGSAWLCMTPPHAYAVVYPAVSLDLPDIREHPDALERLVGNTRATILRTLATPATTSQLVAQLGLSLGTIGDHLAVLRTAGVVEGVRSGRSVLYRWTELGQALAHGALQAPRAGEPPSATTPASETQATSGM